MICRIHLIELLLNKWVVVGPNSETEYCKAEYEKKYNQTKYKSSIKYYYIILLKRTGTKSYPSEHNNTWWCHHHKNIIEVFSSKQPKYLHLQLNSTQNTCRPAQKIPTLESQKPPPSIWMKTFHFSTLIKVLLQKPHNNDTWSTNQLSRSSFPLPLPLINLIDTNN